MTRVPIRLADGRAMTFYVFPDRGTPREVVQAVEDASAQALSRPVDPERARSRNRASALRFNRLLNEWVAVASHRQDRTFLPPEDFCPLCPSLPGGFATEVPTTDYDLVVFQNKFPSLLPDPDGPDAAAGDERVVPARGECEVVLYAPRHDSSLAAEPVEQIWKLVQVWSDRYRELSARPEIATVFIFENRGTEIGVTLTHPHGQIYGYPFVPPVIARELDVLRAHRARSGRCLLCDLVLAEQKSKSRIVLENEGFAAYIPFAARWPYETHIVARRHHPSLLTLSDAESRDLAAALKAVVTAYDRLFDAPFPYVMAMHQAPSGASPESDEGHLHIELAPPLRSEGRLKYLAGSELGAGMFINDTLAEDKAAELRALVTPVAWSAMPEVR